MGRAPAPGALFRATGPGRGPAAIVEVVRRDAVCLTVVDRERMAVSPICSTCRASGSASRS